MRADLQGLEITNRELKQLSGISKNDVLRPLTSRQISWELLKSGLIMLLLLGSYFVCSLVFLQDRFLLVAIHLTIAVGVVVDDIQKIVLSKKHRYLMRLFDDVDRYNSVIQAIAINDQLEAAGNTEIGLKDREKVVHALQLTRADLVRALKTERILRKNHRFIARNSDLFADNLTTLASLQISDRASEHGRLLNAALEIAVDVQEEMRKLQNQRFS